MAQEDPADEVQWPILPRCEASWIMRLFASSRYFASFAVAGAFLSAVTLYVYGTLVVLKQILATIATLEITIEGAKHLQVVFIELTDVFLLGTVLFIVAFGLYQLFLQPDLPVPGWLKIRNLDQLTERLIEVVGVLLSVTFLAYAAERTTQTSVLEFGAAVAIVIAALSLLLVVTHRLPEKPER